MTGYAAGLHGRDIRALLFDVDGTLYRQAPLRARMGLELALEPVRARSVRRAARVWRAIRAFRRTREALRGVADGGVPLDRLQYEAAAEAAGMDAAELAGVVEEWIERRPLRHLRACRRRGAAELLAALRAEGLRAAVLSDYPAREKLRALGLAEHFGPVLCATDPEVDAFKPHPKGFRTACARLGLEPARVLYVGDRPEVDGAGAAAAGMPCVILRPGLPLGRSPGPDLRIVSSFAELRHALVPGR